MQRWIQLLILFIINSYCIGQKIQYSKPLVKMQVEGDYRLVADISGFHHLIHLAASTKPSIAIYNNQLQLKETIELNYKIPEKCDIRLLKLKDNYILYIHPSATNKHYLAKITGTGVVTDISYLASNPADSIWNRTTAAFQLFDMGDTLALLSHTYLKDLKKIRTAIIKPNGNTTPATVKHLLFPFNLETDELKEITYKNNLLHILKTTKDEEGNNTLTLYKINGNGNKLYFRHFDSGKHLYHKPNLRISDDGAGIFVYATITVPNGYKGARPSMFVAQLDSVLNEVSPAKTIADIYKGNTASVFVVEKDLTNGWIDLSYIPKVNEKAPPPPPPITGAVDYLNFDMSLNPLPSLNNYAFITTANPTPSAVRISVLNNELQKSQDSLVKNKGSYYKLHPAPYAQFMLQEVPYLVLVHEIVSNKKGLAVFYPNSSNKLATVLFNVYNPYNYLLHLLQPSGVNHFIVPFTYKKEIGLMKIQLETN